ncbi:MAG: hypothetical protein K2O24_00780 [Muribaculaceae bacterium]|nr:hypothetical protein [Muribaculaceae bacterium]
MEISDFSVRVLKPAEGFVLTKASEDIPENERVYCDKVFLAVNDSPDNWMEVPAPAPEPEQEDVQDIESQDVQDIESQDVQDIEAQDIQGE